jgi:hypothetical protein
MEALFRSLGFVSDLSAVSVSAKADLGFRISVFSLSSAGNNAQYDIRITQYGSIKIEQLCKTNPIFGTLKMIITLAITMTTNYEPPTTNYSKQTQSNPTCGEQAQRVEPPALSELVLSAIEGVEGFTFYHLKILTPYQIIT